ncbi:MAG: HD-GYP domain-containing protein [Acidobacteriota bacterium]|nr:HD-GYP domain-containing protein [Acidobacteriota bacterium]
MTQPIKRSASSFTPRVPDGSPRLMLRALITGLQSHDAETFEHSKRVVRFSLRLARELSLDRVEMESLALGALLHDIGKIRVPDAILHKPGKLTPEEWLRMRNHPLYGKQILSGIEFLEGASRVVVQHHEHWDGSGYPWGLAGKEIDRNARIFAVADAYDAMTSDRVYRAGLTYEAAAAELNQGAGTHFDPKVVEAFFSIPRQEWEETTKALASSSPAQRHGQKGRGGMSAP